MLVVAYISPRREWTLQHARVKGLPHRVKIFLDAEHKRHVVMFDTNRDNIRQCEECSLSTYPILASLIQVKPKRGKREVLVASLLDSTAYATTWICKLYQFSWNKEEKYKRVKKRLKIENFLGRTSEL